MSDKEINVMKDVIKFYFIPVFIGVIVSLFIIYIIKPIIVIGNSMYPTYHDNQLLIASSPPEYNNIDYGDIIVFKKEKIPLIKRVVGKEGDLLIVVDGILYRNNVPVNYYTKIENPGLLEEYYIVDSNQLFCIGDNYNNSTDCREFGSIKYNEVYRFIEKEKSNENSEF